MKKNVKLSDERKFLDEEKTILAEERTLLSYVRTAIALVGFIVIILKFYFDTGIWTTLAIIALAALGVTALVEEFSRFRKLKKQREKMMGD